LHQRRDPDSAATPTGKQALGIVQPGQALVLGLSLTCTAQAR